MAVAFGGTVPTITPSTATSITSGSWTISGSNLVIVVYIALSAATQHVTALSWSLGSGTTLEVKKTTTGSAYMSIWAIPAPTSGSGTFTVTLDSGANYQVSADYFTGADQTTPCPTGDAVSSIASSASLTLTPTNLTSSDASAGAQANTNTADVNGVTPNQTYLNDGTAVNMQAGYNTGTGGVTFALINSPTTDAAVCVRVAAPAVSFDPATLPFLAPYIPTGGVSVVGF